MRAFLAFALPAALRLEIDELRKELEPQVPGVRFLKPDTIHLTLRFLGPATPAQLETLRPLVSAAAAACPASVATIGGLGMFPERGAPRVLWLGVSLPEPVLALQHLCESAAVASGFAAEPRAFTPHLTLGRWRDRVQSSFKKGGAASHPPPTPPRLRRSESGSAASHGFLLEELTLFRSDLRPDGAIHTPLDTFPLASKKLGAPNP